MSDEVTALMGRFESLGDNCELGMCQKHFHSNALNLMRYAGSADIARLIEAIETSFAGFATEADMEVGPFHAEWEVTSRHYGFNIHTDVLRTAMTLEQITAAEMTKLKFLANKLMDDIRAAPRVFVRRARDGDAAPGVQALHAALRKRGPCTLLWVSDATDTAPCGSVVRIGDGLYHGFQGGLTEFGRAIDFQADRWVRLLRNVETAIDQDKPRRSWFARSVLARS